MGKTSKQETQPQNEVEKALLRRALGFSQEEVHTEDVCDKKTGEVLEEVRRKKVVKEVPPDVRALLFWLKNRLPGRWSEQGGSGEPEPEFDDEDEKL